MCSAYRRCSKFKKIVVTLRTSSFVFIDELFKNFVMEEICVLITQGANRLFVHVCFVTASRGALAPQKEKAGLSFRTGFKKRVGARKCHELDFWKN